MADYTIDERVDITDVVCPMTFVKAKVAMEELEVGQFKLDITLQGVYTDAPCIFSIYLLTRSDKYFKTIYLGNTVVNSGHGKYKDILNPSNINNSGYAFKDICGIATTKNNDDFYRMYSLWDDETFLPENVIYKQPKENTPIKKTTQTVLPRC